MGRSFKPNWLNYSFLKDFEINYEEKEILLLENLREKELLKKDTDL